MNVAGLEHVSAKIVTYRFGTGEGDVLDPATLRRRVGPVHGMGDFERIVKRYRRKYHLFE